MDKRKVAQTGEKMRKELEDQHRREEQWQNKKERRLEWAKTGPFTELIQQNRELVTRARALAELLGKDYTHQLSGGGWSRYIKYGPVIAMGEVEGSLYIGACVLSNHTKADYSSSRPMEGYSAKLQFSVVNQETYELAQHNPDCTAGLKDWNLPEEESYIMRTVELEHDELFKLATELAPTGGINPIKGIKRAVKLSRTAGNLKELEASISAMEEAAANPELNPILAEAIIKTEQAVTGSS